MNTRLQHLFDRLEKDRISFLTVVTDLSNEELAEAPPGKWSIQQILSHLITSERLTLLYLRKKVLGIKDVANSGMKEELKMVLLKISQRLPFRFKAPRFVVDNSPTYDNFNQALQAWEKVRRELKEFLETIQDGQTEKMIYKHVRAGMMNIQHGVIFTREHYRHHLPQIKKLLPGRFNKEAI